MMTEEQAFQTRCCGPEGCGYPGTLPYPARWCIASQCMAWRWISRLSVDNPSHTPGAGQTIDRSHGYCGHAGQP